MGVLGSSEARKLGLGSGGKGDRGIPIGSEEHGESPDRSWWRLQLIGGRKGAEAWVGVRGLGLGGWTVPQYLCKARGNRLEVGSRESFEVGGGERETASTSATTIAATRLTQPNRLHRHIKLIPIAHGPAHIYSLHWIRHWVEVMEPLARPCIFDLDDMGWGHVRGSDP